MMRLPKTADVAPARSRNTYSITSVLLSSWMLNQSQPPLPLMSRMLSVSAVPPDWVGGTDRCRARCRRGCQGGSAGAPGCGYTRYRPQSHKGAHAAAGGGSFHARDWPPELLPFV